MPATARIAAPDGIDAGSPERSHRGSPIVRLTQEGRVHAERHRHGRCRPFHEQRVGRRGGRQRLAQTAGRQHPIAEILRARNQQVHVALQPQVLKTIVEQVDRRAERALGDAAGYVSIGATSTGTPGSARASISGSSPALSSGASTPAPSDTIVTPAVGAVRP